MNFGAFFLSGSPVREDPSAVFARLDEYIVLAEEVGYDSVWFAEHPWDGASVSSGLGSPRQL